MDADFIERFDQYKESLLFFYSLPVFFDDVNVMTRIEFLLILAVLLCFFWFTAPQPEGAVVSSKEASATRDHLVEAWLGRKPLWMIFWVFFIVLNALVFYVDGLAISGRFTVSSWDAFYFILFTPTVFWTVCIWRNSANTRFRFWAAFARLASATVFFDFFLKLVLRFAYARIFFNCQEAVLDYAACF